MNTKMQQNIEDKITATVEEILRTAQESLDNNNFYFYSNALAIDLPKNTGSILRSFVGERILTVVHPALEDMFESIVEIDLDRLEIRLPIVPDKKTRK